VLCSVVVGYQCFGGPCCLPEGVRRQRGFPKHGILLQDYMALQCRRPELEYSKVNLNVVFRWDISVFLC
jgi:hypothetical protein